MDKNLLYQLSKEFEFSKKGGFEKTATIEIKPPSMNSFDEVSDFEQLFMGSIVTAGNLFKSSEEEDQPPEEEKSALQNLKDNVPTANEIRMLITISQEVKLRDLFKAFKKLAVKDAKLDEKTPMKASHFDKLEKDDALGLMCEYASFFTFPSLLGGGSQEESGSEQSAT